MLEKLKSLPVVGEKGWILIAPVARSGLKTWKLDGFKEVILRLLRDRSEEILLVGDEAHRPMGDLLTGLSNGRICNLMGKTSLREVAALISRSALLLANDSALIHLGYELRRPVVAIFGPTHHEKYGHQNAQFHIVREPVFCSPCERSTCRYERHSCFEDLQAEKVFESCLALLRLSEVREEEVI